MKFQIVHRRYIFQEIGREDYLILVYAVKNELAGRIDKTTVDYTRL